MEKTKFEKECADMCADCYAKGLDICREDADTVQPMFARCGLCGKVFCEYNNHMTVNHLCWECQTAIEQNVDCNEEIIDPDLFRNLFTNNKNRYGYQEFI